MTQLERLTKKNLDFRRERDWEQFHNSKDQALSLVLEATEVLEHFQWKNGEQIKNYLESGGKEELQKELADVMNFVLLMAHDLNIDLEQAISEKIEENGRKYPIEKAYGSAKKYTQF